MDADPWCSVPDHADRVQDHHLEQEEITTKSLVRIDGELDRLIERRYPTRSRVLP